MLGVDVRDHGIGGRQGENKINIYCQPSEPTKKDGIWIQAPSVFPVNEVVLDNYVYRGEKWVVGESFPNMPDPRESFRCVAVNNKIYCMGGVEKGTYNPFYSASMAIYDIATKKWSTGASMSDSRVGFGCVAVNNKIYCMGGNQTQVSWTLEIYDIASNTWTKGADMPIGREYFGCVVIGNKIYCIGGYNNGSRDSAKKICIYNISTNTWTTDGYFQSESLENIGCIAHNDNIYIIGGCFKTIEDTYYYNNEVNIYNVTKKTWTKGANVPVRGSGRVCTLVGNKIYCMGGIGANGLFRYVEIYDIASNTWSNGDDLPIAKQNFGCVYVGNRIYCLGGLATEHNYLSSMNVISLISKQYTEGQVVLEKQDETLGKCCSKLFNTSTKITGLYNRLTSSFDNAWLFKDADLKEYPTYYGEGTKWIKFKN